MKRWMKKVLISTMVVLALVAGSMVAAAPASAGGGTCIRNAGPYGSWNGQSFGISYNSWNYGPLMPAPNNGTACGVSHVVVYAWTCVSIQASYGWYGRYCAGASNYWVPVNWYGYGSAWRS
jgi:hypothetical protein